MRDRPFQISIGYINGNAEFCLSPAAVCTVPTARAERCSNGCNSAFDRSCNPSSFHSCDPTFRGNDEADAAMPASGLRKNFNQMSRTSTERGEPITARGEAHA